MHKLFFLILILALYVECARWSECHTCMSSLSKFVALSKAWNKMQGKDKLMTSCNFVRERSKDSKQYKVCEQILTEVMAHQVILHKIKVYRAKHKSVRAFCARELSKSYCPYRG
ncbi:unnamed protein product [Cylicocyclus nassatus]|uniref:Saposin B-type domain-containing protein n=1 Tax=Cylicocyclus nassatus TaxID=53992 RepID=A0AA36GNZ2_CYLNA|nr:unnamed protein product [Cylicocyclus nassatus]